MTGKVAPRTQSIHNPYTSALYHSNQPLTSRALEAPVAYALACLRSDVVHGEGPVAKRLASRRRRTRRRANRIHMGAADGGKGELIAVGRVVPEEFAGPRTAEGGGSRRARRRDDGRVDEVGNQGHRIGCIRPRTHTCASHSHLAAKCRVQSLFNRVLIIFLPPKQKIICCLFPI